MANLRDRGYPQSRTEKVNRSDKRNALMTNDIGAFPYSGRTELGTNPVERVSALDKLANAYNNRVFGNSKMPLIAPNNIDYVTDDTDERAYMSGYNLRDRNNNRLAFAHRDVRPDRTGYYVGVDNLPYGDNYVSKDITTPFGNITAEYDGDGTASLGYETSPNVYYLQALARALMSRGNL